MLRIEEALSCSAMQITTPTMCIIVHEHDYRSQSNHPILDLISGSQLPAREALRLGVSQYTGYPNRKLYNTV